MLIPDLRVRTRVKVVAKEKEVLLFVEESSFLNELTERLNTAGYKTFSFTDHFATPFEDYPKGAKVAIVSFYLPTDKDKLKKKLAQFFPKIRMIYLKNSILDIKKNKDGSFVVSRSVLELPKIIELVKKITR